MSTIKPLPSDVADQVKASVNITSLNEAVLGLVKNSLDAQASRIIAEVDFSRGSCCVEDDGEGIAEPEFHQSGGLGKPFHTSKQGHSITSHGCCGTFLASLGALSILTVLSRKSGSKEPAQLVLYQAKRVPVAPAIQHQYLHYRKHGTKVTVQDLFGKMPVRVKQRPMGDGGKEVRNKAWGRLCNELAGLALAWNRDVQLTIRSKDDENVFRIRPRTEVGFGGKTPSSFVFADRAFDPEHLCHILAQVVEGGLASWSSWVRASASSEGISVQGLVSKRASPSQRFQYISLGIHHLPKSGVLGSFYDAVNSLFTSSEFGTRTQHENSAPGRHENEHGREDQSKFMGSNVQLVNQPNHSQRVDRHPMYYIRVKCGFLPEGPLSPPSALRNTVVSRISSIIEAMILGFLDNQHLRPRKQRRKRATVSRSSSSSLLLNSSQSPAAPVGSLNAFASWSRMKSGVPVRVSKVVSRHAASLPSDSQHHPDVEELPGSESAFSGLDEVEAIRLCKAVEPVTSASGDQLLSWTDDTSGQLFRVNARTGWIEQDTTTSHSQPAENESIHLARPKKRLLLDHSASAAAFEQRTTTSQTRLLMETWQNPVFQQQQETSIPTAILDDAELEQLVSFQQNGFASRPSLDQAFRQLAPSIEAKITRQDLLKAEVIAQVDSKFILAKIFHSNRTGPAGAADNASLIIIDQHAADERIRVERLMAELCRPPQADTENGFPDHPYSSSIATLRLDKPILFNIRAREQELFEMNAPYLADWGIQYLIRHAYREGSHSTRQSDALGQLVVLTLPPVIAERCRLDPELLRDILFKEVWLREEHGRLPPTAAQNQSCADVDHIKASDRWLYRIHDCPKGILDMVNSRSCRSAIMFNDKLNLNECQELVQKLACTVFPFQCAHGRPSMLPLSRLTALGSLGAGKQQKPSFAEAWKSWNS